MDEGDKIKTMLSNFGFEHDQYGKWRVADVELKDGGNLIPVLLTSEKPASKSQSNSYWPFKMKVNDQCSIISGYTKLRG